MKIDTYLIEWSIGKKGFTQMELAQKTGSGRPQTIYKIAEALNINPEQIRPMED